MPSAQPLNSQDPAAVGGYRLIGRLGAGGQGVVFLGESPSGERVAVKLLRFGGDARERRYFVKELAAARKVDPFCTARILDADVEGDLPYIVSEFIDGPSLRQVVREDGPLRGSALHRLAIGTATALVAIHQADVVHRDFKPANVLLGPDGPRVIDFGVAHVVDATISGHVTGTPAFMAPEQLRNEPPGRATDMFAWGGTIVYAATGRAPFGEDHLGAVVSRIQHVPPDLGDLDGPLREIAAACLDKDPARRPSARQALSWLLGEEVPRSPGDEGSRSPGEEHLLSLSEEGPRSPSDEGRRSPGQQDRRSPGGERAAGEALPWDPRRRTEEAALDATMSVTAPGPAPTDRSGREEGGWSAVAGATPPRRRRTLLAAGSAVVCVAALAVAAATLLPGRFRPGRARTSPSPTPAANLTWFDTLGLPLRTGWTVADTGTGRHVLTRPCAKPKEGFFETTCTGFWVMGPKQISRASEGFGAYQAGRRMYYPSSGAEPCPGLPSAFIVTPQKPRFTESRQIGGRPATYSEYVVDCVDQANPQETVNGYTEREWYVADRQVLIVDVDADPDIPGVIAKASWR
ncbi:serine/threonine-protein kinase [Actinoallomurus sp. CA-150999]|uniref:serine/threonine-protein kinase n=1 Tax=Actinoallomurus sp. CA-150999 TaxID=3239887 RepID=UPI003D8C6555